MAGFIKIHRKITEWEWYNDPNTCRVFFHLIFTANYKDKPFQGRIIKRGQVVIGLKKLSEKVGLSVQQVRTSLNKLKSTNEITIESTNQFTLITLVNYSVYQDKQDEDNKRNNNPINKPSTNEQQTDNKRITTSKEGKEYKEGKEEINNERFEEFWNLYDYKKSKPKAILAYEKAIKIDSHENILNGVKAYIKARGNDKQYWKHPTTWLNTHAWQDEYSTKNNKHNNFKEQNYDEGTEGFNVV